MSPWLVPECLGAPVHLALGSAGKGPEAMKWRLLFAQVHLLWF